jgi:hypothetical protein
MYKTEPSNVIKNIYPWPYDHCSELSNYWQTTLHDYYTVLGLKVLNKDIDFYGFKIFAIIMKHTIHMFSLNLPILT